MSNEITEHTITSCYIMKAQNGQVDFISRFAIFVWKRELCISALFFWGIGYNKPTVDQTQAVWNFACAWGKDVTSFFSSTTEIRSLLLVLLATDALVVRNWHCWLLESNGTQQKQTDNCILAWHNNYAFARRAFVTKNSNQATRRSPPRGHGQLCTRLWTI